MHLCSDQDGKVIVFQSRVEDGPSFWLVAFARSRFLVQEKLILQERLPINNDTVVRTCTEMCNEMCNCERCENQVADTAEEREEEEEEEDEDNEDSDFE